MLKCLVWKLNRKRNYWGVLCLLALVVLPANADDNYVSYSDYVEKNLNATTPFTEEQLLEIESKLLQIKTLGLFQEQVKIVEKRNGIEVVSNLLYMNLIRNFSHELHSKEILAYCLQYLKKKAPEKTDELLVEINSKNFPQVFSQLKLGERWRQFSVIQVLRDFYGDKVIENAYNNYRARQGKTGTEIALYKGEFSIKDLLGDALDKVNEEMAKLAAKGDNASPEDVAAFEYKKSLQSVLHYVRNAIREDYTASVSQEIVKNKPSNLVGRDSEINELLESFVRKDGSLPVILAAPGVGASSLVKQFARVLYTSVYPDDDLYREAFDKQRVIEIPATEIWLLSKMGTEISEVMVIRDLYNSLNAVRANLGLKKLLVVIDHAEKLHASAIEELVEKNRESEKIRFLLVGEPSKFTKAIQKSAPELLDRKLHTLQLLPLNPGQVEQIVREKVLPELTTSYHVEFSSESVAPLIKGAKIVYPNLDSLAASILFAKDLAILEHRAWTEADKRRRPDEVSVTEEMVYKHMEDKLGIPVNPFDANAFSAYKEKLQGQLKSEVLGQEPMVEKVVEAFTNLMADSSSTVKSMEIMGPTGVGKTELIKALAKYGLNNSKAVVEIDGNAVKDKHNLSSIIGTSNGYVSADQTQGLLGDFLLDESRGGKLAIVLINEVDKAHSSLKERLMEFQDTGILQTGNGTIAKPKKVLLVYTSNKVDEVLYPESMKDWSQSELDRYMRSLTQEKLGKVLSSNFGGSDEGKTHSSVVGRTDYILAANPMVKETAVGIARKKYEQAAKKWKEELGIEFSIEEDVIRYLGEYKYDIKLGARPVMKRMGAFLESSLQALRKDWNFKRGDKVSISFKKGDDHKVVAKWNRKIKTLSLPYEEKVNPYQDKELIETLGKLYDNLRKGILGQDEPLSEVADAIVAHKLTADAPKALSLFLIGPTGVGKTETVKGLSEFLYGSKNRFSVIDMGNKAYAAQVNFELFGGKGSDKLGLFEEVLRANPEGAVIAFDETSNVGGANVVEKTASFKLFYPITDEKTWTSPVTGEVYDLGKYAFVFNGNDGEEFFLDSSNDFLREKTYQEVKDKAFLEKHLLGKGVPAAFLGRVNTILYKPLMSSEIAAIAKIKMEPILDIYRNQGVKIHVSDKFYRDFGYIFFNPHKGARSLEVVARQKVKAAIDKEVYQAISSAADIKSLSIELSLVDNMPLKPYRPTDSWERKVELALVAKSGRKQVRQSLVDVTESARVRRLLSKKGALVTGYHELGHAVGNDPKVTKREVDHITIWGMDNYLGFASYETDWENISRTKNWVIGQIASLRAGGLAQKLAGFELDGGWSNDNDKVNLLLKRALDEFRLDSRLQVSLPASGTEDARERTQAEMELIRKISQEWLQEADALALKRLTENWNLVRAGVNEIIKKGSIDGKRFKELQVGQKEVEKTLASEGKKAMQWKLHYTPDSTHPLDSLRIVPARSPSSASMCRSIFKN